jgi:tetratricopeptide (TPR) repeat protein
MILARAARGDAALATARAMFGYDRRAAARLLAALEPLLVGQPIDAGLPDDADAALAWSVRLRELGRRDEADAVLRRIHGTWPGHRPSLLILAVDAVTRGDFRDLERLLPDDLALDDADAVPLALLRARRLARAGERERARAEIDGALVLAADSAWAHTLAGDALFEMGADDEARRLWTRALYGLPRDNEPARRHLLVSLAELERRQGRPAEALRHWRAVLALDPDDLEARHAAAELLGSLR